MATRNVTSLEDVIIAIRQIDSVLDKIGTKHWDRHQLRIVNAAVSIDENDYIIQKELTDAIAEVKKMINDLAELMDFELNKKADKTVQTGSTGGHTHTQM